MVKRGVVGGGERKRAVVRAAESGCAIKNLRVESPICCENPAVFSFSVQVALEAGVGLIVYPPRYLSNIIVYLRKRKGPLERPLRVGELRALEKSIRNP